jgi:hypothetical protein
LYWKPRSTTDCSAVISTACFAVRRLSHVVSIDALKTSYYAYFHSLIKYGIICWGNSSNANKVFVFQKRVVVVVVVVVILVTSKLTPLYTE